MQAVAPRLKALPRRWRLALLAALALPVLLLGWMLFGPRGFIVEVTAKSWQFEIQIEKRVLETGSGWCDELPDGATETNRRLIADPSGVRPGLIEHCRYSLPTWRKRWVETAQGQDRTPPHWPMPRLAELPPDQIGAERQGRREARYLLQLREVDGDRDWICQLPLAQWQRFRQEERFRMLVDRHGVANCASVPVKPSPAGD